MDSHNFRDDLFEDTTLAWVESQSDAHFTQRYLREEESGPIYCETLMAVHGIQEADPAIALIRGPWDWWEHGRISDFVENPDGSSDQILFPVWWFFTRVGLHISPPEHLENDALNLHLPALNLWRVPILLSEHFIGPSSIDVYPDPEGDGMILRGRFHGVEYKVPAVPNSVAEGLHLDAESGTMPIPFPKGSGWIGLLRKLEARAGSLAIES